MFARCHGPIWRSDDFSECFQLDYLQTLFPLILTAISIIALVAQLIQKVRQSEYYKAYKLLNSNHVWDFHPRYPIEQDDDVTDATGIDDEIDRNAELALRPTVSVLNRTSLVQPDKPRGEVLVVSVEVLCIIGEFVIALIAYFVQAWGSNGTIAAVAGIVSWTYILIIALWRLFTSSSDRFSMPNLWNHTACLYGGQWIIKVLRFRSTILHPRSQLSAALMITSFVLISILLLIVLSSRKGNKVIHLEYEGDIPPAREQVASIFSLASFSWADSIVWRGYQRPVEMEDVWNLAPKDKAASVLSHYRQIKKTSRLAWHLVKHFKAGLLAQGAWAAFSGLLIFVPTLLLRAILRYVEHPEDSPRASAWFFVILLFVSGLASALADGQALWIGRKTCIQLRAIIVGELYSKALKRKAGASTEKVLGENKEKGSKRKGFWYSPLMLIGRNKKKYQQQSKPSDKKPLEDPNSQVTAGAVINLMAVDSFKVSEISAYLHFLWASTPVQLVLAIVLLYLILGYSCVAGIFMMILLAPINVFISKRFAAIQTKILAATDARIHTTNEVLTNIRVIKYFAWEQRFLKAVDEKRATELKYLRTRYILWSTAATIWGGVPIIITLLSFAIYTMVEKKDLVPSVAFTALSLFQILRIPLDYMADMVAHVQEAKVSVDRVEEFLNEEDTEKYKQLQDAEQHESGPIIGFDHATFTWGGRNSLEDDDAFRVMDVNLRFAAGQLNVIAGATGSGKTSLLMALLGEMTLMKGSVHLPGGRSREDISRDPETGLTECVAYCAQQAWLVNDSLKQNILFASPWNAKRYKDVIKACSLERDLEILDNGDETLIGEKGVTLSGGQKQRISLARALYCDARHIILDDILSAVDSHTAKWIFDHAIMGPLMYNRTCLLVTHNVALCLPHANFAVFLENGRITAQGTANDVINSGKLDQNLSQTPNSSKAPSRAHSASASGSNLADEALAASDGIENRGANGNGATDKLNVSAGGPAKAPLSSSAQAMQEGKATGSVKLDIIVMYLKSMGHWYFWLFAAVIFAAQQLSSVATNVWIREWANAYSMKEYVTFGKAHRNSPVTFIRGISGPTSCLSTGTCTWSLPFFGNSSQDDGFSTMNQFPMVSSSEVNPVYYLVVYAIIGGIFMVITFVREGTLFYGSIAASKRIHTRLMECVSRAKFRFFDTTPLGQIMNRFSKDIENVDQEIAPVAVGVVHCMASIVTIVIVISVITPGFLIAGFFITLMYYFIGKFYISSSRDLKRLESIQRSPLYQLFGETLSGMTTIRAYGDERRFIRENLSRVNTHNRPFIYVWATNRWLAFRVDIAGALVSFFAGVFVVLSVGKIDAGAAGLALSYAVQFTENVLWFVRLYSTNEQNMNSVERIKEYLDVEQEAPAIIPDSRPKPDWPSRGAVEFVNYSTRYRKDFDLVLRNISLKISPCQKVGVVGRTGAGKSSLALALFRALEAEEGKIVIDDLDIGTIGLQDLRENIVMVPQDPTLFSGTIRSNLDPFGLFTDEEIFTALRRVQLIGSPTNSASRPGTPAYQAPRQDRLRDHESSRTSSSSTAVEHENSPPATPTTAENKNIFLTLSSSIAESGTNLSQGQRQLLCLARALLKSPKVLLMDEATASIDYTTDSKIQETIRELENNTIITIAHRLKTIIDYDRVVVMDHGEVVEVGEPWELLKPLLDDASEGKRWFRGMCEQSGELEILEREAKKSWESRRLVDDS